MNHRPPNRGAEPEKPSNFKGAMKSLFIYCKPWLAGVIIAVSLSLISTVLGMIAPAQMSMLTNTIKDGLTTSINMDSVMKRIIAIFVIYSAAGLISCISGYVMVRIMQKIAWSLRKSITEKINRMPLKYFDKSSIGDILSRITNDVDLVSSTMNSCISPLVMAIIQFVGITVIMFATNGTMALTAIGSSVFGFVFMFSIIKRSQKYFRMQQKNLGDINGHVEETYSGHDIVRVYGAAGEET